MEKQNNKIYVITIFEDHKRIIKEYHISKQLAKVYIINQLMPQFVNGQLSETYRNRTYRVDWEILRGSKSGSVVEMCDECWKSNTKLRDHEKHCLNLVEESTFFDNILNELK